ncbi:MAG: hypothetical protein ACFFFO_11640, partial [Candidatus Thorarchaeota archaeon]
MRRVLIVLLVACILLATPLDPAIPEGIHENQIIQQTESAAPSADPGISVQTNSYMVLEMVGGDITPRGNSWSHLLNSSGIFSQVVNVSQVLISPELLDLVTLVLVDASLGSSDGVAVPQEIIDLLIRKDVSLILTGRSAWILHRLRDVGPPSLAVSATTVLLETAEFAGAAYMVTPNMLTLGSSITTETGVVLPKDTVQTEVSRIVDLTGAAPSNIAALRFESMPLDIFLYSPEDSTKLTSTGKDLLENIIAFSSALRESETPLVLASHQASAGSLLEGGFSYQHEPTIAATYYAVHSAMSLFTGS